jgi:hypothetical protein
MQNEDKKKSVYGPVRKTIEMDKILEKHIQSMADEKNWSFSYMSYCLLRTQVAERLRKKGMKLEKDNI